MERFIKLVNQKGMLSQLATDFSLIVDDKQHVHGCIFNIKIDAKSFKLVVASPAHEALIENDRTPTIQEIIRIKDVMLLG